jgi:peptide-methionine (R)-S-oxide reductase
MKDFHGYTIYRRDELPELAHERSEAEWRNRLPPAQYRVLREGHTEPPGSGEYYHEKREGVYYCAAGGAPLFSSKDKFASGSGWPSFTRAIDKDAVILLEDDSLGMHRIEVLDAQTGSHLGHVFTDGPPPTGLRFCINSLALVFAEEGEEPDIP